MESKLKQLRIGDFLWVPPGTFPGYPFCVFAITAFIDMEILQLAIQPPYDITNQPAIWINYDPNYYKLITNRKTKEFLEILYGRVRPKN